MKKEVTEKVERCKKAEPMHSRLQKLRHYLTTKPSYLVCGFHYVHGGFLATQIRPTVHAQLNREIYHSN